MAANSVLVTFALLLVVCVVGLQCQEINIKRYADATTKAEHMKTEFINQETIRQLHLKVEAGGEEAKEMMRLNVESWLKEHEAKLELKLQQKDRLTAQRIKAQAAGALPPSAVWMSHMKEVLANMTPADIVFPGTHDSGTYNLQYEIAPSQVPTWVLDLIAFLRKIGISEPLKVIKLWAQTQVFRIYDQLYNGMRYIDLRVTWDPAKSQFRTLHMIMGDEFDILLTDIARFMNESKEEILILQFGDFGGFTPALHQTLIARIENLLGSYLYPRTQAFATYSQMVSWGKRIVAFYDAVDPVAVNYKFWTGDHLYDNWANKDNLAAMLPIETKSVEDRSGVPNGIYKLQWVLTASAPRIVSGLLDPLAKVRSLHGLTRDCNGYFNNFLTQMNAYRMNLLMVDFFEETDNLDQSKMLNRQQCNDVPQYRALTPDHQDCRGWAAAGLCATNTTISHNCPLSCKLCKQTVGVPGTKCTGNGDCLSNNCNTNKGLCLNDTPRDPKDPCGVDFQCWSGSCSNFECSPL